MPQTIVPSSKPRTFQLAYVPFVSAAVLAGLGISLGTTYTVGWGFWASGFDLWMIAAVLCLGVGCFMVGFGSMLRERTPPLATGSGTFPLADARIEWVDVSEDDIDWAYVEKKLGYKPPPGVDIKRSIPGYNAETKTAPIGILALGGFNVPAFGLHIGGGSLGYLVILGFHEFVLLGDTYKGEYFFTPRTLMNVDRTGLPLAVQIKLRNLGYKPSSALYFLGDYAPGWADYVNFHSEYVQSVIDPKRFPPSKYGEVDRTNLIHRWLAAESRANSGDYTIARLRERIKADAETMSHDGVRRSQVRGGFMRGSSGDVLADEHRTGIDRSE